MGDTSLRIIEEKEPLQETPPVRVALVNVPFASADRPSIQCGLLKAILERAGHPTEVLYLNLEMAAELGAKLYDDLAQPREDLLLGDWLFALAAFGPHGSEKEYFESHPSLARTCKTLGVDFEHLCKLRREVLPARIERWAEEIDWSRYEAVGFTSMFKQNAAAFALARAVKERHPEIKILFGGANFDGPMGKEYVRALPFIDYAVIGEGDVALPRMIDAIGRGRSALGIPGVIGRSNGSVAGPGELTLIEKLDDLPDPDYDEYFETLFRLGRKNVLGTRAPLLLFETARGCWWGQRQHCTFCGINNRGIRYRSKSPAAAAEQLQRLASRYKIVNFEAVDNILDLEYIEKLCKPLAESHYDYHLFYEVKSNLKPKQLRTMKRAGINVIQPGIESLNTHILSLMRKGVTMLRNVRLLKWAAYYGMRVRWNILTGFPGETLEDYEEQLRVVRQLKHLPPPHGTGPIWLERFSPYFFDESFPIRNIQPLDMYRFIYPEERFNLDEIAYFFTYEMDETLTLEVHQELREAIEDWRQAWFSKQRPELIYQRAPDWMQIVDRRNGSPSAHAFEGYQARIYELCGETERTVDQILGSLIKEGHDGVDAEGVRSSLQDFCEKNLMLHEDGRFLSLAQPANPYL